MVKIETALKSIYNVQVSSPYTQGYQDDKGAQFETHTDAGRYISQVECINPRAKYRIVKLEGVY